MFLDALAGVTDPEAKRKTIGRLFVQVFEEEQDKIGGADVLDGPARDRCDLVLRLGQLTWPHLMVRALIAEQLYRAQTILAGHPYHRE